MNKQAKHLYEKMVDFKRFAIVLLAAGAFFYLGVIIPSNSQNTRNVTIMIAASASFIAVSLLFFIHSKQCRERLLELEDQEYLTKK